jgi:predicted nucleic acid-binding protein
MAISWHVSRIDPSEAALAQQAIHAVMAGGALVPSLWLFEVANALLTAERRQISNRVAATHFFADLDALPFSTENQPSVNLRTEILRVARRHNLTAYDATYLELALRTNSQLATFDRKLADACRAVGGQVFGDTP